MTAPSPHVVYDNTTTDLDWSVGGGPPGGFGSQIRLAGKARVVTEFLFGYNGDADVKVTLKYHENDGPKGGPGTVFFDSGESAIDGGLADKTFSGLKVFVPDTFIWTVSWTGPKTAGFGLTGFFPATIGKSGQLWDWPDYVGPPPRPGWEKYDYNHPGGLRARITAVTSPVHPGWDGVIVAQILAGVINDGGGWIKVGNRLIRVPPRQPVESMLAALPLQLAQRLLPVLGAAPHGTEPEAGLRQQLHGAITNYLQESRS
jgi:hypothetical protein